MTALSGKKKLIQESTKDVSLFLSTAAQLNNEMLSDIFKDLTSVGGNMGEFHPGITVDAITKFNKKNEVLKFLKEADISIENIIIQEKEIDSENGISVEINGEPQKTKHVQISIFMNHGDGVVFNLNKESSGTQKLFFLIGVWLEVLENGYTLVLDELQNSLHPKLVEHLVKMFHNPELNKKGAQIIFTTHESSLLDQEIFRRDQIWFCEKENNATQVFSLSEFKVRKGVDDLEKAYLSGRYGAVPFLR
jgi:AAA15 family ATPase/GTPase